MLNKIKNIFNQKSKRTFVVAEMSANHSSNIKNAFKIVDQAKLSVLMQLRYSYIKQIE